MSPRAKAIIGHRAQVLLSLLGVVALLELVMLSGIELALRRELRRSLAAEADTAGAAIGERLATAAARLVTEAHVVAQEPRLKAAVATDGVDRATLEDVARELRATTGWDVAAFLDAGGGAVALDGVEASGALPAAGGYWVNRGALYRVARIAIVVDHRTAGTLLAGEQLTDARLAEAAKGGRTTTLLFAGEELAAASLAPDTPLRRAAAELGAGARPELSLLGERYLTRELVLDQAQRLRALILISAEVAMAPYLRLRSTVFALAAGGFVLAVGLALLLSIGLSRPVAQLAQRVESSEARATRSLGDLQRLIEHVPDSIAVHVDGRFVYANPALARMLGKDSVDQLIGDPVERAIHVEDRARFLALGQEGHHGSTEIRFHATDGHVISTEVAALPVELNGMRAILAVAHDLSEHQALEARLVSDQAAQRELELAHAIQRSLVPGDEVIERGVLQIAGHFDPAAACGGDWWTHHDLPGGKALLLIGDVTGHGIPSAMLTAAAKAASDVVRTICPDVSVTRLLEVMNEAIRDTAKGRLQMTCFAAVVDPTRRTVSYANAGHDFPYLARRTGGDVELGTLAARGSRLGDLPGASFEARSANLTPGDTLVFYTDGLVDSENPAGEQFGTRRFRALIRNTAHLGAAEMRKAVVGAARRFTGDRPGRDDVTLVIAKLA